MAERRASKPAASFEDDDERQAFMRKITEERERLKSKTFSMIPNFIVNNRDKLLIPSVLFAAVVWAIMIYIDQKFHTVHAPFGQVSMQFAVTEDRARRIFNSLSYSEREWAKYSIGVDYLFMVAYTLALTVATLYRGNADDISVLVASCVVIGTLFDALEGVGLGMMLYDPQFFSPSIPAIVTMFAITKFVLLGVAVVYIIKPFGRESKQSTYKRFD